MSNTEADTFPTDEELDALYREELDNISDGSHTFKELYEHRAALLIALMCQYPGISWWSTLHHDGTMPFQDRIIAGMQLSTGSISYHLRAEPWMQVLTDSLLSRLDRAPEYDGHCPADVTDRLVQWITEGQI
jgi:hypothetical protein